MLHSSDNAAVNRRWRTVKDFMYGLTGRQFVHHALEMKQETEALFLLATVGDLTGLPILPPIYSLFLLPYLVPEITAWKRQLVRPKEFWEKEEFDLHGV